MIPILTTGCTPDAMTSKTAVASSWLSQNCFTLSQNVESYSGSSRLRPSTSFVDDHTEPSASCALSTAWIASSKGTSRRIARSEWSARAAQAGSSVRRRCPINGNAVPLCVTS